MNIPLEKALGMNTKGLVSYHCPYANRSFSLLPGTRQAFINLVQAAKADGMAIAIISAHRSFQQQRNIWNSKWSGARPCLDANGQVLSLNELSNEKKLAAILKWSAFPGLSRHHWGTDLDIFDGHALRKGYKVALLPEEFSTGGPCAQLGEWLAQNLNRLHFFRPYFPFAGGVAEEPWHISHAPGAEHYFQHCCINKAAIKHRLVRAEIEGIDTFLQDFDALFDAYFKGVQQVK